MRDLKNLYEMVYKFDSFQELSQDLSRTMSHLRAAQLPKIVSGVNLRGSLDKALTTLAYKDGDVYVNFENFVEEAYNLLSKMDLEHKIYPIYVNERKKVFSMSSKPGFSPRNFGSDHDRVKHVGFLVVHQLYKVI